MKKLKIFLLLSILLCFGFVLSSEVHAQGVGPKVFEVGDVLPATTQLKISWGNNDFFGNNKILKSDNDTFTWFGQAKVDIWGAHFQTLDVGATYEYGYTHIYNYDDGVFIEPYNSTNHNYLIVDTSSWNLAKRTITYYNAGFYDDWTWEDLNAPTEPSGPKVFEVGDELPAGYIKISWDFTGVPFGDNDDFWIYSSGDFFIHIWKIDRLTIDIMHEEFFANTPGEIVMTLSSPCTITSFDGDSNYYEYIDEALSWEVLDYTDGYRDGYDTARRHYGWIDDNGHWYTADEWGIMSYEHAREEFGYYDPITERWLSVEEYLDLYTGQDGFYNNFDKYFIPAMIIVFGGAIVLTILKVFKGRE